LSRELRTPPLPAAHVPVGYGWQNSRCSRSRECRTATPTTSCRTSGSGEPLLAPRPLRTVRETFASYGSSLGQRPCEARPGSAPPADDTPSTGRGCLIGGQPGRYCGSAGYRDDFGGGGRTSNGRCDRATILRRPLRRLADGSRPPTPRGSLPPFGWGECRNPYPAHYRPAFAFSPIPYPQPRRLILRLAFPCGRATGLPRCIAETAWVRPRLDAGGSSSAPGEFGAPGPGHVPFGPSLSAPLACPL
jgi:hypothetical protein